MTLHEQDIVNNIPISDLLMNINARVFSLHEGIRRLKKKKPKWHDLRKNPDDLPKGEGLFVVYRSLGKIDGYTVINGFKNPHKDIVAWCETPKFEEG